MTAVLTAVSDKNKFRQKSQWNWILNLKIILTTWSRSTGWPGTAFTWATATWASWARSKRKEIISKFRNEDHILDGFLSWFVLANDYQVGIYSKITTAINPYITITITEQKLMKLKKKLDKKLLKNKRSWFQNVKKLVPTLEYDCKNK